MRTVATNLIEYAIAVAVAGLGGAIRLIASQGEKRSFWSVTGEIFIAGFAGVLVDALLIKFDVQGELKVVIVAISGYTSREVIALLRTFAMGAFKAILNGHDNGKDGENR